MYMGGNCLLVSILLLPPIVLLVQSLDVELDRYHGHWRLEVPVRVLDGIWGIGYEAASAMYLIKPIAVERRAC